MKETLRRAIVLVFALVMIGNPVSAENEELTLEDCLALALEHNPLLLAADQRHAAAEARVVQARAIPQLSLDYDSDMQDGILDVGQPGETYLGLSTTLEFPGRRALRIDIASHETTEVHELVITERRKMELQVKTAFYEVLLARTKLGFARKNLDLAHQFVELATIRFETGDVARVEVLRAQVEEAGTSNAWRTAENAVAVASAQLALLIGRDPVQTLSIQGELAMIPSSIDLAALTEAAISSRPEVRALQVALDREKLTEKQARRGRWPDFDLGVARHWIEGEGSFWDVTLSVPIPLFQQQYRGETAEAQANQRALQHDLDYLKAQIALEVRSAHRQAETAQERIALFDERLLTESREVYDMNEFSYSQGEIGSIQLIDARRSLLDTNTAYAEALFDYAVAVAELERAVGQDLEGVHQ